MQKIIAKNKFAKSDYEILDKYVAGIELQGWEVKSIRANNVNLKNSFCSFKKHELFVSNMHVSPWMRFSDKKRRFRRKQRTIIEKTLYFCSRKQNGRKFSWFW
ncbi:MAG: SsrA-binding protein [Mycoplasmataceae bacterium]|nr:SsrA-binding protein [Mycoplasmataceae bacterium]